MQSFHEENTKLFKHKHMWANVKNNYVHFFSKLIFFTLRKVFK